MMFVVVVAVRAGCCLGGGGVCVWGSVCGRAEGSNGIDVRSVGGMRLLPGGLLHWRCCCIGECLWDEREFGFEVL